MEIFLALAGVAAVLVIEEIWRRGRVKRDSDFKRSFSRHIRGDD